MKLEKKFKDLGLTPATQGNVFGNRNCPALQGEFLFFYQKQKGIKYHDSPSASPGTLIWGLALV